MITKIPASVLVPYENRTLAFFLKDWLYLEKSQLASLKTQAVFSQNGQPVKMKDPLRIQDLLIDTEEASTEPVWPVMVPLDILYEDAYLLVVNKPAGIPVHPGRGHYFDTMANRVCARLHTRHAYVFGRLDKDTSGILCFAKNAFVLSLLEKQRLKGLWKKTYLAFAKGRIAPGQQRIEGPVRKIPGSKNRYEVHPEGKPAATNFSLIDGCDAFSLLSLQLETGRTHQIRVHLQSISHPLLGDSFYNKEEGWIGRSALHACRLTGEHPVTHVPMQISCPMPADLRQLQQILESRNMNG